MVGQYIIHNREETGVCKVVSMGLMELVVDYCYTTVKTENQTTNSRNLHSSINMTYSDLFTT